jgi:tetratricopeptide (TPR) repeat protein
MKDLFEYIERYYAHKLSKVEQEEFEKKVKEDKEFRYEVKAYLTARKAVELKADERLRNKLNQIGNKMFEKQKPTRTGKLIKMPPWKFAVAAAAALIIVSVFTIYIIGNNKLTTGKIIAQYYAKPDPSDYVTRDVSLHPAKADLLWDKALSNINNKQYDEVLSVIDTIMHLKSGNVGQSTLHYFQGYCYFQTKQYEKAIQSYSSIKAASHFYFEARMNSSLAYLKTNNVPEAKNTLTSLMRSDSISPENKNIAVQLLKKIEKMK